MLRRLVPLFVLTCAATVAQAQSSSGTLLIVPANGEVRHANDEAHATLMIEEQDKDKAAAASRVNLKMKQGVDIVKQLDAHASLKTRGYYTYAVYAEEAARPSGKTRQQTGWRVGQYLDVTTTSLETLPKTIAAVQRVLALNGLQFGLSAASSKQLEQARIEAALRNLNERLAMIAHGMGRNLTDAVIDTIDFDASGAYAQSEGFAPKAMLRGQANQDAAVVEEPSFEPGETTLNLRLIGKIRFK